MMSEFDLPLMDGAPRSNWRFVDAGRWQDALTQIEPAPWFLPPYLARVADEADAIAAARKRAKRRGPVGGNADHQLDNAAWLSEIRAALGSDWWHPVVPHAGDMVLGLYRDDWEREGGGSGVALEYTVQRHGPGRRLRIIYIGLPDQVRRARTSLELPAGFVRAADRKGDYRTGPVGTIDLTTAPFRDAVEAGRRAVQELQRPRWLA